MIHKILNITSPHLRACNIIYLPPWATSQEEAATPATPCICPQTWSVSQEEAVTIATLCMSPTLGHVARRDCDSCNNIYVPPLCAMSQQEAVTVATRCISRVISIDTNIPVALLYGYTLRNINLELIEWERLQLSHIYTHNCFVLQGWLVLIA